MKRNTSAPIRWPQRLCVLALATGFIGWGLLALRAQAQSEGGAEPSGIDADRTAVLERGEVVYAEYCAGCHGVDGRGEGEAAMFLYPKPRDFVEASYKFSSRPSPGLPTDEDLMQVLREGLQGTAMTGFDFLVESDLVAVREYIKTFSDRWEEWQPDPVPETEDPWAEDVAAGVREGDYVYHVEATCLTCHPSYHSAERVAAMSEELGFDPIPLRPAAHLPVPRETSDGDVIMPPDFARDYVKTGAGLENLHRVIGAGITGTAMPTWSGVLPEEKLWGLAHYVRSLAEQRPVAVDPETWEARPAVDWREENEGGASYLEPLEEGAEFEFP